MSDIDMAVMKCMNLVPLTLEKKRLARKAMKDFNEVRSQTYSMRRQDDVIMNLYHHFSQDEQHHLHQLFNFLANYDASQFKLDLGNRNFMQTFDGKLVVLDPVVSREVVDLITANQTRRYKERENLQRNNARY